MAKALLLCECKIFKSQDSDYDTLCTPTELKKIKKIRQATSVPWTLENLEHILYFLKMYKEVFKTASESEAIDLKVVDRDELEHMMAKLDYRKLGFQNKNPTTDVRGAKLLGVIHLYNFIITRNDEMVDMLKLYQKAKLLIDWEAKVKFEELIKIMVTDELKSLNEKS